MDKETTATVEVNNAVKTYGDKKVVNDISFCVSQGEIFGLIGPNGAGKTTIIRMMMDIIKPDSGNIRILGKKLSEDTKNHIGYLPEERGLYKKQTVMDTLLYMSALKGAAADINHIETLLKRVGMLPHKDKKIEEMSRGMGQLIQFLVTVAHNPDLIILDEPFSGLDPVNTELLKGLIEELKNRGKAIIFSTHQMSQVEELCDRLFMINRGNKVLYGNLTDIKQEYGDNSVFVNFEGDTAKLDGVIKSQQESGYVKLFLDSKTSQQDILQQLVKLGFPVNRFEVGNPSLHEIFLRVAGGNNE